MNMDRIVVNGRRDDVLALACEPLEVVRIGFVGLGVRAKRAVERMMNIDGAVVSALCDFVVANIDAAKEAARFGIDADRAANYHADAVGTEVIYEAVCETVRDFRASRPMAAGWKRKIDEDFKKRGR